MARSLDIALVLLFSTTGAFATKAKPVANKPVPAAKKSTAQTHKHSTQEKTNPSRISMPKDADAAPAVRYGQLSKADCEAELNARNISFKPEGDTPGVLAPLRLTGPLHGVEFRGDLADKARETSPYEIVDCRLVLALDDFAVILAAHDIVEVRHYSMYRPPPKDWPTGKLGARHNGALAFDAGRFVEKDGTVLVVDQDFHGAIDAKTCGDGAGPKPVTPEATRLRAILCEAVDQRLFNVVLTPNYNKPHHNHFHLEVTAGVKWFLVH